MLYGWGVLCLNVIDVVFLFLVYAWVRIYVNVRVFILFFKGWVLVLRFGF